MATVTEDTNFVWRAAAASDVDYRLVDARFRNKAPPSVGALVGQRRRWMSGTVADGRLLPLRYRPPYATRVVAWAFSPLVPLLVGAASGRELYGLVSTGPAGMLFVYMLLGVGAYRKHPVLWPLFLALTPVAVVIHAAGSLWGWCVRSRSSR